MREYRRSSRVKANLALIGGVGGAVLLAQGWPVWSAVFLAIVVGVGILGYGYFVASQLCARCGNSYAHISSYVAQQYFYVYLPLTAPSSCPSCGAKARY
jgi:hypothetical protein